MRSRLNTLVEIAFNFYPRDLHLVFLLAMINL